MRIVYLALRNYCKQQLFDYYSVFVHFSKIVVNHL